MCLPIQLLMHPQSLVAFLTIKKITVVRCAVRRFMQYAGTMDVESRCLKIDNGTGNPDTQLSGLVEFKN